MIQIHFKSGSHNRLKSAIDSRKNTDSLHVVAHGFATAAHDALVNFTNDCRRSIFAIRRLLTLIMNLPDSKMVGHILQIAVARFGTNQTISRMV